MPAPALARPALNNIVASFIDVFIIYKTINIPVNAFKGITFVQRITMKHKILIADDDPGIRDIFKIVLTKAGYDIEVKEDANEIFENKFSIPDLFLIDKLLGLFCKVEMRTSDTFAIMFNFTYCTRTYSLVLIFKK